MTQKQILKRLFFFLIITFVCVTFFFLTVSNALNQRIQQIHYIEEYNQNMRVTLNERSEAEIYYEDTPKIPIYVYVVFALSVVALMFSLDYIVLLSREVYPKQ